MKVDMSKEAVTLRMQELNQLWELAVALQSSDLKNSELIEKANSQTPIDLEKEKSESE